MRIRDYTDTDAAQVGILIADTYVEFNLGFVPEDDLPAFLGPFHHARSTDPAHRQAIREVISSQMVYIAEINGDLAGVLRGRTERLASLFVRKDFQRLGVGRALVRHFEAESVRRGTRIVRVAATVYAVPFYARLGYKKSTGLRSGWSFSGHGLPYQPMKKNLV